MHSDKQANNPRQPELVLFTRPECHLCDVAGELLLEEELVFSKKDIESDIGLITRYGTRIPVVYRPDTGAELGWPFTASRLHKFLEASE